MPTRSAHLEDIRTRLTEKIAGVDEHVWRGRIATIPPGQLPAICLYGPEEESGESIVTGGHGQYRLTHTLAIEVRVAHKDGFDVEAESVVERVKVLLFTDPAWTGRFKPHPRWRVREFIDRRGEESFCGAVLTMTVADKRPTEYPPAAPNLSGVTAQADVDGDGNPDIIAEGNAPEEEEV